MPPTNFRDSRTYLLHLFRVLHRAGAVRPRDIYEDVADRAHITSEQRATGSGEGNPVYRNRIRFARLDLIDAGFIVRSQDDGWKRGVWELNDAGKRLAESDLSDQELEAKLRELAADGSKRRAQNRKASRQLAGLVEDDEPSPQDVDDEAPTEDAEPSIADLVDAGQRGRDADDAGARPRPDRPGL